jgi:lipoprotein-releasing system permease protein
MKATLSSWIATRYLWSRHSGRFAPLLTATAIASIAVGVMALIVVMSVMRGFRAELADRLMGFNAHITITKLAEGEPIAAKDLEAVLSDVDIRDVAPYVQGEVVAQSVSGGELVAQGARVRGLDAARMGAVEEVSFYFPKEGDAVDVLKAGRRAAIVGNEIVGQLMVHPDFGDRLELIAPLADVGPTGEFEPNRMEFEVEGVFRAGVFDYDSKYVLTSIEDARDLLGQQAEEGYLIRLADTADTPDAAAMISERLPEGWRAQSIDVQNKKLFAALRLERVAMGAIMVMVLLIASCAIAGVILLLTGSKRKDVAVLMSMGLDVRSVKRIFLTNAAIVGAAGSLVGLALGLVGCAIVAIWPIRLPSSYYLDFLPVEIDPITSLLFAACGMGVAVLASIYPVHQASRMSVIDVLRYE